MNRMAILVAALVLAQTAIIQPPVVPYPGAPTYIEPSNGGPPTVVIPPVVPYPGAPTTVIPAAPNGPVVIPVPGPNSVQGEDNDSR